MLLRESLGMMTEVPFPEASSGITLVAEVIGDAVLGGVEPLGRVRKKDVLMHPDPLGVAASQERGAGR